jgi:hypothetical protein
MELESLQPGGEPGRCSPQLKLSFGSSFDGWHGLLKIVDSTHKCNDNAVKRGKLR